jgi:hypothetical protein
MSKFDDALLELSNGLHTYAEQTCTEGLKEDPHSGVGWHTMGLIFKDRSNTDAVRAFRSAIMFGHDSYDRIKEIADVVFPELNEKMETCAQILQAWVEKDTGYVIQGGIFKGVKTHPQASTLPLLLGYKDIEIHGWLVNLYEYRKIFVDDPYYAVGLKRLYPSTEIVTVESSLAKALSDMNRVSISYNLHGTELVISTSPLEEDVSCDIIAPSLEPTKDNLCVKQQPRSPNHPVLKSYPDYIRFLAVIENNPYYYWYWRKHV